MYPEATTQAIELTTPSLNAQKQDIVWMLSLYGTAIGAGTLFLPIDAGLYGAIPLLFMMIFAFPMTFYSHQALCRFVLSSTKTGNDLTHTVEEHFGPKVGNLITFLYFFAIYPILLLYAVAITNTAESFIIHQLHLTAIPRSVLSLLLVTGLMAVVRLGQEKMVSTMSLLVYPFISILVLFSFYLIPHWNLATWKENGTLVGHHVVFLPKALWLIIPLMVFSFNHSPIISSFAVSQRQRYGQKAEEKSSSILKYAHLTMIITVLFFVLSCVLSLSPGDLAKAKQQNISILSYLANHFHSPFIAYMAPLVAFIAITKSFLGHYLGAREGLCHLTNQTLKRYRLPLNQLAVGYLIELFILISCWVIATINPNVLTLIETLGGPVIAIILFLMPTYAMIKIPAMKRYYHPIKHLFMMIIGLIALSASLYGIYQSVH